MQRDTPYQARPLPPRASQAAKRGERLVKDLLARDPEQLRALLGTLTPQEETVVRMHYGIGEPAITFVQIGYRSSVGGERIRRILHRALEKMENPGRVTPQRPVKAVPRRAPEAAKRGECVVKVLEATNPERLRRLLMDTLSPREEMILRLRYGLWKRGTLFCRSRGVLPSPINA